MKNDSYVLGFWSGHDASYCVLDGRGSIVRHVELERYVRQKECAGDIVEFFLNNHASSFDLSKVVGIALCHNSKNVTEKYAVSWNKLLSLIPPDVVISTYGHHEAHAAHAYYSSPHDSALVVTCDGGGYEDESCGETVTGTWWKAKNNVIERVKRFESNTINVGGLWTRVTRYVFRCESGWPQGHQAGTIMAMAALGNSSLWKDDFRLMFTRDHAAACSTPAGHVKGMSAKDPRSPKHSFLHKWEELAKDEQTKFDLAAAFQECTEEYLVKHFSELVNTVGIGDSYDCVCFAGGVALNSVAVGKLERAIGKQIFVPPVPYDGGLCIGAAQILLHRHFGVPKLNSFCSPYMGATYSTIEIEQAIISAQLENYVIKRNVGLNDVVNALADQKIVAVFNGSAESGRRALGNRSILADPRMHAMKAKINENVKHRQWFRPFAPSILQKHVADWFEHVVYSPYMTHVVKFKHDAAKKVPAVIHYDGSARLQTVNTFNQFYNTLLELWNEKTGVPILLNTSFNDREPICETPKHAIDCFLRTDIDALYFNDANVMIERKS